MLALLGFLTGPIGRWLVIGVVALAAVGVVYHKVKMIGWDEREAIALADEKKRDERDARITAERIAKIKRYEAKIDSEIAAADAQYVQMKAEADKLREKLKARVPVYVTKQSDDRIASPACGGIPYGFVRHWNASSAGKELPEVAAEAERRELEADSGVVLSRVAEAHAYDAGQFRRCVSALEGWERWYEMNERIYNEAFTK